jgi:hypothetical protein
MARTLLCLTLLLLCSACANDGPAYGYPPAGYDHPTPRYGYPVVPRYGYPEPGE